MPSIPIGGSRVVLLPPSTETNITSPDPSACLSVPLEELAQGLTTLEDLLLSYKDNLMRGEVSLPTTIHRHSSCHKILII
jgi:hypothetical protein